MWSGGNFCEAVSALYTATIVTYIIHHRQLAPLLPFEIGYRKQEQCGHFDVSVHSILLYGISLGSFSSLQNMLIDSKPISKSIICVWPDSNISVC